MHKVRIVANDLLSMRDAATPTAWLSSMIRYRGMTMVTGEPNDVRVKYVDGQWTVQIVENGAVARSVFKTNASAENFAEAQRLRLGLPGKPPIAGQR
jgi:hypothetical protein